MKGRQNDIFSMKMHIFYDGNNWNGKCYCNQIKIMPLKQIQRCKDPKSTQTHKWILHYHILFESNVLSFKLFSVIIFANTVKADFRFVSKYQQVQEYLTDANKHIKQIRNNSVPFEVHNLSTQEQNSNCETIKYWVKL